MYKFKVKPLEVRWEKDDYKMMICRIVNNESCKKRTVQDGSHIVIKGEWGAVNYNYEYSILGEVESHSTYGDSIKALSISKCIDFNSKEQQRMFLREILTERQYKNLIAVVDDPIKALQEGNHEELLKVKGIGEGNVAKLIKKFKENEDYSEIFIFFSELGLSNTMIKTIAKSYTNPRKLIEDFNRNPYILSDEVSGIGFKKADVIAVKSGIGYDSPLRVRAFILYLLNDMSNNEGHTYTSKLSVIQAIISFLDDDDVIVNKTSKLITETIQALIDEDMIMVFGNDKSIGLQRHLETEKLIAEELIRINSVNHDWTPKDFDKLIVNIEKDQGYEFTDEQLAGVKLLLEHNLSIVYGLAGSGKTSLIKSISDMLKRTKQIALCALSGKAANRIAEVTNATGYTIHRLLGYNPEFGYNFDKDNQLPFDIVVLDETSMVDIHLFYKLIQSVATGAKLMILGDPGQLEAIGAGAVLKDLINADAFTKIHLTKIHRQAQKSAIITKSRAMRKDRQQFITADFTGKAVLGELEDLELDISNSKSSTADKIISAFKHHLPLVDNKIMDIQVIVPMKKNGVAATSKINKIIQDIYNPMHGDKKMVEMGFKDNAWQLRVGDKVICRKNNYSTMNVKGVQIDTFNGSMGIVIDITDKGDIIVDYKGIDKIIMTKDTRGSIELAYAITIHLSQGDQFHTNIIGIDNSSFIMLTNELLYTAMTRTKTHCVLVGQNAAIRYAVTHSNMKKKRTLLEKFVNKFIKLPVPEYNKKEEESEEEWG